MELEDRIIWLYLRIEEIYEKLTKNRPLRRHGFPPALSDAEVLTMELVGEMEGRNGDRAIWRYFHEHWRNWFPNLPAYKTFAKQCANLCWLKQEILRCLFANRQSVHIIDGLPLPVCHLARSYRSSMLAQFTSKGYCAAKDEYYYGLRGHALMDTRGYIANFILTPADVDERLALNDLIANTSGLLIADKGFISHEWNNLLGQNGINLQTPLRKNMSDDRPKPLIKLLNKVRKPIETAFSILVENFSITKIKAHDIWHYMSKLYRKLLAYNFNIMLRS